MPPGEIMPSNKIVRFRVGEVIPKVKTCLKVFVSFGDSIRIPAFKNTRAYPEMTPAQSPFPFAIVRIPAHEPFENLQGSLRVASCLVGVGQPGRLQVLGEAVVNYRFRILKLISLIQR